jgi:CHAD domain-containing protein
MSIAASRMVLSLSWNGHYNQGVAAARNFPYTMSPSRRRYDLLRTRLERFTRMLQGVEAADPRAVHRTRVASRRLRELLPVLELDPGTSRKLGRRLRKVTRDLGPLRESDVLHDLARELAADGRAQRRGWQRLTRHLQDTRDRARARVSGKAVAGDLRRIGRKLEHVASRLEEEPDGRRPRHGWRWAIDARVARRAQTLRAAIVRAGAVYLHERLHEVRIALKKLRYAVELAADADGVRTSADLRLLQRTQELLGRIHDLQVLTDHVRQAQAALSPPDPVAWRQLDALVTCLEQDCRRLHARYVSEGAKLLSLCDRLGGRPAASARRAG